MTFNLSYKHFLILSACFLFSACLEKSSSKSLAEDSQSKNALEQLVQLLDTRANARRELFSGDLVTVNSLDGDEGENIHIIEGDIAVDDEDIAEVYGPQDSTAADDAETQKVARSRTWPGGVVFYEISPNFQPRERQIILGGMREVEQRTCIRFREANNRRRLFIVNNEQGCWSFVGKHVDNSMRQRLSLGRGCVSHRTVVHELGHALGLWHEQSRPDRDRYIAVHRGNIRRGMESNFDVRRDSDYHGEVYDFNSIMHYSTNAFSSNRRPTISIVNNQHFQRQGSPALGRGNRLSAIDVRQINKHYGCHVPNTGPGTLRVRVSRAGSFRQPRRYFACVRATDSNGGTRASCTNADGISTTDPRWNQELVFRPANRNTMFRSFEIEVRHNRNQVSIQRQTIWVEARQRQGSFCVTASLCVNYQYRLVN